MPAIEKFEITPKQEMACKKIEKAFKEAKKIGLVFLAKSQTLCAYRENALEHAIPFHRAIYTPVKQLLPNVCVIWIFINGCMTE